MRCESVLGFRREATAMCLLKKDAHDLLIMTVSYVFENLAAVGSARCPQSASSAGHQVSTSDGGRQAHLTVAS